MQNMTITLKVDSVLILFYLFWKQSTTIWFHNTFAKSFCFSLYDTKRYGEGSGSGSPVPPLFTWPGISRFLSQNQFLLFQLLLPDWIRDSEWRSISNLFQKLWESVWVLLQSRHAYEIWRKYSSVSFICRDSSSPIQAAESSTCIASASKGHDPKICSSVANFDIACGAQNGKLWRENVDFWRLEWQSLARVTLRTGIVFIKGWLNSKLWE